MSALAYEVLLTRLFAIIQWHHFAYMIISLALLGYGASGALLVFVRQHWSASPAHYFSLNAIAFGILSITAFLLAQAIEFNPFEMAWDKGQFGKLAAVYFILMTPFFCAANALGLALIAYPGRESTIYSADLLGAGLGAAGTLLLLYFMSPMQVLLLIGVLGCLAGFSALPHQGWRRSGFTFLAILTFVIWTTGIGPPLQPSPFKDLSQAMQKKGIVQLRERNGPLGQVIMTHSPLAPQRHAPGLGLTSVATVPKQYSAYVDGHGIGAVTPFSAPNDSNETSLAFLGEMTSSVAYLKHHHPQVLALGAGTGMAVLQAIYHKAMSVKAVELNPHLTDLFLEFSGPFTNQPSREFSATSFSLENQEPRSFIRHSDEQFDLIHLMLVDAYGPGAASLHALQENYLYTTEAVGEYLHHLKPGGQLSITRWLESPPRDSLRLFATMVAALQKSGVREPANHIVMLRSWQTVTLVIGNKPFTQSELTAVRRFCQKHGFDLSYAPGLSFAETNQFNQLHQPWLYLGAKAILADKLEQWQSAYPFSISPVNDDRPYFFHSFRWSHLTHFLTKPASIGKSQIEWGYLILLTTLVTSIMGSLAFILLPLWFGLNKNRKTTGLTTGSSNSSMRLFIYFFGLGTGFMLVEIAFIQRFTLLLGNPLYSIAVVLTGFLLFAGMGSLMVNRWLKTGLRVVLMAISILIPAYLVLLPIVFDTSLGWAEGNRLVVAVTLIAPLAFLMGMPFPKGLAILSQSAPAYTPWAWAINGCASVTGAMLAKLVAIEVGFTGVLILAMFAYLSAAWHTPVLQSQVD